MQEHTHGHRKTRGQQSPKAHYRRGSRVNRPHLKGEAILVVVDPPSNEWNPVGPLWRRPALVALVLHKLGCTQVLVQLLEEEPSGVLGAQLKRKPVGNGGAVPCGTCKANPPGDLGGEEVWAGEWLQGSWALGQRAHLRLAKEEAA